MVSEPGTLPQGVRNSLPRSAWLFVLAVVDGLLLVRFLAPGPVAGRAVGWLTDRLEAPGPTTG